MPQASGSAKIANSPASLPSREPFSQHFFIGGNSIILNILKDNIDELSLTASTAHFNETLASLADQLQNRTAQIAINDAELDGDLLTLTISIIQSVGHKLPTGFPSRRAWIHLTVTDTSGEVVFESGKPNSDGSITGNNADETVRSYEPHYDVITQSDQVQIYESIMMDVDGKVTYTLLRGADYIKDNRLLPLGFDKENAIANIAVYGAASTDDNFIGGSDQTTYQIDTQGHSGPFTITAELLYQTISYQFAQDLFQDSHPLITLFANFYQAADKMPTIVAEISAISS